MTNQVKMVIESVADRNFTAIVASSFHVPGQSDLMFVPPSIGTGILYEKELEKNLTLVFWKFTLHHDFLLLKYPHSANQQNDNITLLYIIEGDTSKKESTDETIPKYNKTILLFDDNAKLRFRAPGNQRVKAIAINITIPWLKKEIAVLSPLYEAYLLGLQRKMQNGAVGFRISNEESWLLADIAQCIASREEKALALKAKTLLLVADFFSRFVASTQLIPEKPRISHYEQMQEVKAILQAHLEKKLPELAAIANQIFVSVSTLKRHFKDVFGKSIYDYYLEMKMNYAQLLITEQGLTVSETAARLQYENVSGFIEMFKKYHGVSPGSLIKHA